MAKKKKTKQASKANKANKASKASKTKKSVRPTKASTPRQTRSTKASTRLETPFIREFTAAFVDGPGVKWPDESNGQTAAANELAEICKVLFGAAFSGNALPPPVSLVTLTDKVQAKLIALSWPADSNLINIAKTLGVTTRTLRIGEAMEIVKRMAQAASDLKFGGTGGGGGESTQIPPH